MNRRHWMGGALAGLAATAGAGTAAAATHRPQAVDGMVVEAVQMPAWIDQAGRRLPLAPGDRVRSDQVIETGAGAALVLVLAEGSRVNLGEKSQLGIQRLASERQDGQTTVRTDLRLLEGFFRFATSSVSRITGRRDVRVTLRTATVGIRGTDFWSMTDAAHDAVCLFEGQVALDTRDQGALSLDKPSAFWARFFDRPVQPVGVATPDQLAGFIASAALKPGTGVAVAGGEWQLVAAAGANSREALQAAGRLRAAGYPAQLVENRGRHEVRIDQLATREDAQGLLARLGDLAGGSAQVMPARSR